MEKILGSGFTIVLGKTSGMERPSALVTTLLASRQIKLSGRRVERPRRITSSEVSTGLSPNERK
jgi:hypothetical protein